MSIDLGDWAMAPVLAVFDTGAWGKQTWQVDLRMNCE